MSCLMVIARKHNESEVSQLMDIVNEFRIEKKYLLIFLETFNTTFLRKKTINFNVIISHREPGGISCCLYLQHLLIDWSFYFPDGSDVITSLCPVLGKRNAEEYKGFCPSHLQIPFGKTLDISFIGFRPYIIYNPLSGSDFLVTKILAKKFGFIPKFIPAKSIDTIQNNQTTYGMVHRVRISLYISNTIFKLGNHNLYLHNYWFQMEVHF